MSDKKFYLISYLISFESGRTSIGDLGWEVKGEAFWNKASVLEHIRKKNEEKILSIVILGSISLTEEEDKVFNKPLSDYEKSSDRD